MATPAAQRRKVTKPLMEKRRRARINRCLTQLQTFLAATCEGATSAAHKASGDRRLNRLEKADILEMTVRYLHQAKVHNKHGESDSKPNQAPCLSRFLAGYHQCMLEVAQFSISTENSSEELKTRLLDHLCLTVQQKVRNSQRVTTHQRELLDRKNNRSPNVQDRVQVTAQDIWRPW